MKTSVHSANSNDIFVEVGTDSDPVDLIKRNVVLVCSLDGYRITIIKSISSSGHISISNPVALDCVRVCVITLLQL